MVENSFEKEKDRDWKSSLRRPPRGQSLLQMPMHTYSYSEWRSTIDERLSKEADEWVTAQKRRPTSEKLTKEAAMARLSRIFPDADQLLAEALRDHITYYGHIANQEAGFDLGIRAHDMLVGKPDGYVIVFATINPHACKRLRAFDNVSQILKVWGAQWAAQFGTSPKDKSEELMELVAAALPRTDRTIGTADPRYIIDCAVKGHLVAQQFFEQTLLAMRHR
jgi:hypothetical protein